MVVKPADGSGGYGIMIGPKAKLKERNIFRKRITNEHKLMNMRIDTKS